jgi:hypothetical protein
VLPESVRLLLELLLRNRAPSLLSRLVNISFHEAQTSRTSAHKSGGRFPF